MDHSIPPFEEPEYWRGAWPPKERIYYCGAHGVWERESVACVIHEARRNNPMTDSGENDIPPSPLEMARDLENTLIRLVQKEPPPAVMEYALILSKNIVKVLTPPPAIMAPVAHEPIDWSEAAND